MMFIVWIILKVLLVMFAALLSFQDVQVQGQKVPEVRINNMKVRLHRDSD